jgi:hypothetical protein
LTRILLAQGRSDLVCASQGKSNQQEKKTPSAPFAFFFSITEKKTSKKNAFTFPHCNHGQRLPGDLDRARRLHGVQDAQDDTVSSCF